MVLEGLVKKNHSNGLSGYNILPAITFFVQPHTDHFWHQVPVLFLLACCWVVWAWRGMSSLEEVFPAGIDATFALHSHLFLWGTRQAHHVKIRVHLCALRIHRVNCGGDKEEKASLHTRKHFRKNQLTSSIVAYILYLHYFNPLCRGATYTMH